MSCLTCTETCLDPQHFIKPGQEAEAGGLHIPDQTGIPSKIVLKQQAQNQEFV